MQAPIWATSRIGASRSSRAISESRKRGGNGERRQRAVENVTIARVTQQLRLQHRLGQLLDEQRHAVGVSQDLLEHLLGQRLAAGELGYQLRPLAPAKAVQPQNGDMRLVAPTWAVLGSVGDDQQHRQLLQTRHQSDPRPPGWWRRSSAHPHRSSTPAAAAPALRLGRRAPPASSPSASEARG